ncbi:MAG: acetyl/propionyl/methylcrotonyl-CoA carboxylase subunit alpha [Actinomycetota bacterium]
MFARILVANRAEIAVRIARTCRELGVDTVAVYSDADAGARHVGVAAGSVRLPGVAPADTYLNAPRLVEAAVSRGCEAVHPGYGFLAESADFARLVLDAGLGWIGPPPDAIVALGDKISARRLAAEAGVPVVPGLFDPIANGDEVREFAAEHGYPVAIKASGGGGGRGFRVVHDREDVDGALASVVREAAAYFGSVDVYVERYLDSPKHLEVQVLAPDPGNALWLGVRDCSFQRRHQKLVEETPPPRFAERMQDMGEAAVALCKTAGYVNAGTVEMLVDGEGDFHFLEVNSRLQVEHTVTEEVLGIDLVACQLKIAAGDPLGFGQTDLAPRGHAIECRINAENPARGFTPAPGMLTRYTEPDGFGVRVDSGYEAGDEIPGAYDSLIAKVVTWGADRDEARSRMLLALGEFVIEGVPTTIPAHEILLENEDFIAGSHTTTTVEAEGVLDPLAQESASAESLTDVLMVGGRPVRLWNPSMSAFASAAVHGVNEGGEITAPMQGTILSVAVEPGRYVEAGRPLMVLEAMKMETTITSPAAGRVVEIRVEPGQSVRAGEILAIVG